jgi:purine catabolism regulator
VEHATPALLNDLELRAERSAGRVFFAERDEELVVVVPVGDTALLTEVLAAHEAEAGVSAPVEWASLQRGIAEAHKAGARTLPTRPVVSFESLAEEGVLGLLDTAGAEPVARRMLAPLLESDNPDHRALLRTAAVWIEHNGAWDPAARELNIHRHTLRNRLQSVERLLALDLSRFADRAELWTALQHVDYPGRPVPGR